MSHIEASQPLVSIITPFLDARPFFEEAIESVLAQTYPHWELMLVDDGATDGSEAIARKYAARYPDKIFYLAHEDRVNKGASASRNLGIRHSRGSLIAFLDADDVYLPQKLEMQVPQLLAQPKAGMLYSATEYWHSWEGEQAREEDKVWKNFGVEPDTLVDPPRLLETFLRDGSTVPCMGSVLVRRETIEATGGWEDSFRYIYTDQVFHAKICLHSPVFVASGCWDRYRQHTQSSSYTSGQPEKAYTARKRYLDWLGTYLKTNAKNAGPGLWRAYRKASFPYTNRYIHQLALIKHKFLG
jgi:glycosyltransferase involved in cell wall biosynthesis